MYEVFVDGAARGQGMTDDPKRGNAAIGIAIFKNQELVGQYARALGRRSNNEAEYEALITGLLICWSADIPDPLFYSDSQMVVNQVTGQVQCRSPLLIPLLATVVELQKIYTFRIKHVPRKYVRVADKLAKDTLDDLYLSKQEVQRLRRGKKP